MNEILKAIEKYNKIVLARHIGPDPDALGSQIALRDLIRLNYPNKEVYAVGQSVSKFKFIGDLDKFDESMYDSLLIILDVPNKSRVDIPNIDRFNFKIKIDHHPFMERFCDIEYIEEVSSCCEIIGDFVIKNGLKINREISEVLFTGIVSDTNRFMFNTKSQTLAVSSFLTDHDIDIAKIYGNLYSRPFKEIRFMSFLINNFKLTDNGLAYNIIKEDDLKRYEVDVPTPANMINDFNNIREFKIWATITQDKDIYRVSVRSSNIRINDILERYHGGGHPFASGTRLKEEEIPSLLRDLDNRLGN